MAANFEAQEFPLEEILSDYDWKREDLDKECPASIRNAIVIKIDDWITLGYFLGIPKEKLNAIKVDYGTEEQHRLALLTT